MVLGVWSAGWISSLYELFIFFEAHCTLVARSVFPLTTWCSRDPGKTVNKSDLLVDFIMSGDLGCLVVSQTALWSTFYLLGQMICFLEINVFLRRTWSHHSCYSLLQHQKINRLNTFHIIQKLINNEWWLCCSPKLFASILLKILASGMLTWKLYFLLFCPYLVCHQCNGCFIKKFDRI